MNRLKIMILIISILTVIFNYRSVLAGIYYVDQTYGNDEYSGLSWEEAKATIGAAVEIVNPSEQNWINIAQGTYHESIQFSGKNIIFIGGFAPGGNSWNPILYPVTIQRGGNYETFHIYNSNVTFSYLIIDGRSNPGIITEQSYLTVKDCTIRNCGEFYGGIFAYFSSADILNCYFTNNLEAMYGSALNVSNGSFSIRNSIFIDNEGSGESGALAILASTGIVENCLFINNIVSIFNHSDGGSDALINNCTFVNNSGTCVYLYHADNANEQRTRNCIFYNNTGDIARCIDFYNNPCEPDINYSDIYPVRENIRKEIPERNNIFEDPLFVSGPDGDYYLSQIAAGQPVDSPCVDAGDPESPLINGTTRTDEVPDSGIVDMGYHYLYYIEPTPTPTFTPTYSHTPTPLQTKTPTPTFTPSVHPTHTPTPILNDQCPGYNITSIPFIITGSTTGAHNDYDPLYGGCTHFPQQGPDVVYHLLLNDDINVLITVSPEPGFDCGLYAVTDCESVPDSCIAGADLGYAGEPEQIKFLALSGTDYYIICDSWDMSEYGKFKLRIIEITPTPTPTFTPTPLPPTSTPTPSRTPLPNDQCPGYDIPSLPFFTTDDTTGAFNDYDPGSRSCILYVAEGPDVVYHLLLDRDYTIEVSMTTEAFLCSLYAITDCNNVRESCVVGSDRGEEETQTIVFDAQAGVDYYIICDSSYDFDYGPFTLEVNILVTPTPTPTSPPLSTSTPAPIFTPTKTPTSPPPSNTPTPLPPTITPTPTSQPSHTPSPTQVPCNDLGVTLFMPSHYYKPGDTFFLDAYICNPGPESLRDVNLFVILDINIGIYWFYPSWKQYPPNIDYKTFAEISVGNHYESIIPPFIWPSGAGTMQNCQFWGALTDREITHIIGKFDKFEFSFSEP